MAPGGRPGTKFWEAGVDGASVTVRFGRTGTAGQTRVKEFGSADAAESYLIKAIGEKERKGYAEVGEAVGAPDVTGAASAAEPAAAAPLVRPDEDTFALPAAWKRNLRPRRGGTQVDVRPAEEHGAANLRQWRRQFTRIVDRALDATTSDAGLVAVARAHESGLALDDAAAGLARIGLTTAAAHLRAIPAALTGEGADAAVRGWLDAELYLLTARELHARTA
ncbi:WGR domain-containing protein [Streptomyces roseicoloratus]|uniref:WGR domain-containing protein n=1 Tax=Streptomyces roseicoloratus TaxID=2508722 RepID=A0ABY9S3X9_9ACTN|nr:WGR domain-containing protein [Streptomyces roseicoloratus]WMX49128.1 WGR domain-containing protein [Streptomyces roseicoloratus]